jgi:TonB family protein
MARIGKGEPFVVTKPENAIQETRRFQEYISAPLLSSMKLAFEDFEVYDVEPVQLPDLFAERPIVVFGKYRGQLQGKIIASGLKGTRRWSKTLKVDSYHPDSRNVGIRLLWARQRIQELCDYNVLRRDDDRVRQVTELGLQYGLLTPYTSFVAIDRQVRNNGEVVEMKQPLPLPEGVSDRAVGQQIVALSVLSVRSSRGVPGGVVGGVPGGVPGSLESVNPTTPRAVDSPRQPIRVGGNVQASKLIHRVEPEYPTMAKGAKVEGLVLLQVRIDEKGNVEVVKVIKGHPLLNPAAVEAVKKWKYAPTYLNGEPVSVVAIVTVTFTLKTAN